MRAIFFSRSFAVYRAFNARINYTSAGGLIIEGAWENRAGFTSGMMPGRCRLPSGTERHSYECSYMAACATANCELVRSPDESCAQEINVAHDTFPSIDVTRSFKFVEETHARFVPRKIRGVTPIRCELHARRRAHCFRTRGSTYRAFKRV